jgi:predicted Zn-dependent protease
LVRFLIRLGANVNVQDEDGQTSLMLAPNDRQTMKALLDAGANFKVKDQEGMTALMAAVMAYQESKAQALVEAGASKEAIEGCMAWIANLPERFKSVQDVSKGTIYDALTKIHFLLGQEKEAVETARQALKDLGEQDYLRARLGFSLITAGDRDGAIRQYNILKQKKNSGGWAEALRKALDK